MKELSENEAFFTGVSVGISLYQNKVLTAHKQKTALKIGDELFYLQSGRERLEEAIDKMCK